MNWYTDVLLAANLPEIANNRRRVLIIEDNLCLQGPLVRLLRTIDPQIEVDWATTGDEVFASVQAGTVALDERYCMVLSDILLPGRVSGMELWEKCRSKYRALPFVLMSGLPTHEYLELTRGYDSRSMPPLLRKPFTLEQCGQLLRELLCESGSQAA